MSDEGISDIGTDHYIVELHIDDGSLPATSPEMQHERRVAIFDLLEENEFRPLDSPSGPYIVDLSLEDGSRLIFDLKRSNGSDRGPETLSPDRERLFHDLRELPQCYPHGHICPD